MASIGGRGDKLDLNFRQGATFGPVSVHIPANLSGCEVRASIRKSYNASTAFAVDCQIVDAEGGKFTLGVAAAVTASMPCGPKPNDPSSIYVWDLEIEFTNGTVLPIFYGAVKVAPEATR